MLVVKIKNHGLKVIDNNGNEIKVAKIPMRIDKEMSLPEDMDFETISIKNFKIIEDIDLKEKKAQKETEKKAEKLKKETDLTKLINDVDNSSLAKSIKDLLKVVATKHFR